MMKNEMRRCLAWMLAAVMALASVPAWAAEGDEAAAPEITASAETAESGKQSPPAEQPSGEKAPASEGEKPAEKPADSGKPSEKPDQKPDRKPDSKPDAEAPASEEKAPAAPSEEKPAEAPASEEKAPAAPGEEKPAEAPSESGKPSKKPSQKPDQKPDAKPGGEESGSESGGTEKAPPIPHSGPTVPQSGGMTMVVKTGNNGGLNLRELPTTASASLGLYPNGTYVTVYGITNGWALVRVYGRTGYMAAAYLATPGSGAPSHNPPGHSPSYPSLSGAIQYMVRTGNSGRLHLRQYASTGAPSLGLYANGTLLMGVDQHNGWVFVSVGGNLGYMMRKFLTTSLTPPADPIPVPPAPSLDGAVAMVVHTGNSGKLHLREGPGKAFRSLGLYPNGTPVEAKDLGNGWCYVRVNGRLGYMLKSCLAKAGSVPSTPSSGAVPGTARIYQKNGSYVNLRSSKASRNNSNVIARIPFGTVVTILEWGKTYTKVLYNGMTGYVITSYLRP